MKLDNVNVTEIECTLPGRVAQAMRRIAKQRGCSEEAIQQEALREYLEQHQARPVSDFGAVSGAIPA